MISFNNKSIIFLFFLAFSSIASYAQISQIPEQQAEQAKQKLADKGIAEDEVQKRLKARGIDLDNLRPEQLPTLEDEIRLVVAEIEKENQAGDTAAVKDVTTKLTDGVDSLLEKQLKENVTQDVDKIAKSVEEGASLEEAIADDLTSKLAQKYQAKTNIYGHQIFFNKSIDLFRTTSSSTTPNSYVLDVGDKIAINIFGASQADLLYEIEEDGFIRPSGMYKIYLKGVTISKAKELLKSRFKMAYMFSDGQFNVDLHTARTITVNIFGEVNQPGSYTISALNTALNAIIAAGGINSTAGVRQIKIISGGKEKLLDVYDFMANPKSIYDYYLHDNDIIFVPKWNKLISANGNGFKINGRFELLENEGINEFLEYTQGLNSRAYTEVISYLTFNGEERKLENYSLEQLKSGAVKLKDGDVITINQITVPYKNYIEIQGSVRRGGRYEFKEGMKLSEALALGYFEEESFSQVAYIRRKNSDGTFKLIRIYPSEVLENDSSSQNILLEKEDYITVYSKSSFIDNYAFIISGAVRNPDTFFYDPEENVTLYDAITMARGLQANATEFGYIIGYPTNNPLERTYTIINIKDALANPSGESNIKLKPRDRIFIPAQQAYTDEFKVNIAGAVRNPGEYTYDPSLSIKDLLVMAGGLKLEAAANKVDVFRLEIDENERTRTVATSIVLDRALNPFNEDDSLVLQPYDYIVVRYAPEFEPMQMVRVEGAVRFPGIYALTGDNEPISSLIQRTGGFTAEALPEASLMFRGEENIGKIVTRIDKAVKGKKKYDITLKGGDVITVPKTIDIVYLDRLGTNAEEIYLDNMLEGSTTLNVVVNFSPKRAGYYVRRFGGGFNRKEASKGKTTVIYPNGQVKRTIDLGFIHIFPKVRRGSEIKLDLKPKAKRRRAEKAEKERLKRERDRRIRERDEQNKERVAQGLDPLPEIPDLVEKAERAQLSFIERLQALQALATIATTSVTTTISTLLLIRSL